MTKEQNKQGAISGRRFLYPKLIKGKLYARREWFSYSLILFLFAAPFLKMKDEQLVLLNFLERKFVFFGLIFTPQDFYLFGFAMLIFILFIVCFTVIFGRLWCGWACPQTIFMEMIFRRIEFWIEGNAAQQKKLDAQPWTAEKIFKKGSKHLVWILISLMISNTFLAYVIGADKLMQIVREPVSQHLSGFISIWIFTFVFYFVFSYVREVVCTVICPYGRLQNVLLDNKSIVVAYNQQRGEPRGKLAGPATGDKGDCVDCGLCVDVCPTGIDIRNGTQLECVNCTACIDACNMVMAKIHRDADLIGFYNNEPVKAGTKFKLGVKAWAYCGLIGVMLLVFSSMIYKRDDVEMILLRASGTVYQSRPDGSVSNLYTAELINKTNKPIRFKLHSLTEGDKIEFVQRAELLPAEGNTNLTFFIVRKGKVLDEFKSAVKIEMIAGDKVVSTVKTTFFSPPK